jgi:hypothetical protein
LICSVRLHHRICIWITASASALLHLHCCICICCITASASPHLHLNLYCITVHVLIAIRCRRYMYRYMYRFAGGVMHGGQLGNNWPLRGQKTSSWEGGVRVTAFLWGGEEVLPAGLRGRP